MHWFSRLNSGDFASSQGLYKEEVGGVTSPCEFSQCWGIQQDRTGPAVDSELAIA